MHRTLFVKKKYPLNMSNLKLRSFLSNWFSNSISLADNEKSKILKKGTKFEYNFDFICKF